MEPYTPSACDLIEFVWIVNDRDPFGWRSSVLEIQKTLIEQPNFQKHLSVINLVRILNIISIIKFVYFHG